MIQANTGTSDGASTSPAAVRAGATETPLTNLEQDQLLDFLTQDMNLPLDLAQAFIAKLSPAQARSLMGSDELSRDDAVALFGLSEGEADLLFGESDVMGLRSNPFGDIYLMFLVLAASLEQDMAILYQDSIGQTLKLEKAANEDRRAGALGKFIFSMVSAAITIGGALHHCRGLGKSANGQGATISSPMMLQLFSAIPNACGDLTQQMYEYLAKDQDIHADEVAKQGSVVMSGYESVKGNSSGYRQGLSSS